MAPIKRSGLLSKGVGEKVNQLNPKCRRYQTATLIIIRDKIRPKPISLKTNGSVDSFFMSILFAETADVLCQAKVVQYTRSPYLHDFV